MGAAHMYYLLSGRKELLKKITMPSFIPELAEAVSKHLTCHGITVEQTKEWVFLTFPDATIQEELFPSVDSSRYIVTLPDGYQVTHIQSRRGNSIIIFPLDDLPREFWNNHQELYQYMLNG